MARTATRQLTPVGETEISQIVKHRDGKRKDEPIARGTIAVWRERHRPTFPAVAFRVGTSPGWFFEQFERWFNEHGSTDTLYIDYDAVAAIRDQIEAVAGSLDR